MPIYDAPDSQPAAYDDLAELGPSAAREKRLGLQSEQRRVLRERLERLERVYARVPVLLAAMTCRHEWSHVEHELINYAILALDEFDASLQEPFTLPSIEG